MQWSLYYKLDFLFSFQFYVLLGFISLFIFLGISNANNSSVRDYFSGGRNTKWYIAMFSIVATETSVLTFISVPGIAYRGNWYFLQLSLGYIVGRLLVSKFLLPLYFSSNVTSIYELIGQRYNRNLQKLTSIVFLFTRVLADGVRFLATAVIVQVLTGWSLEISVLLIGIVTLLYTVSGGLKAILIIDSIQFLIYLSGGLIVVFFIIFSDSFTSFQSLIHAGKFDIFKVISNNFIYDSLFIFNAFIGGILLSFASHGVDYMMVQRVLSCKDLRSAQKAMIGSGFFVLLQFSIFLLAGSLIWEYMDGVQLVKDREFSTFILNYLPIEIRSIMIVGVLSAAMSTLSSSINSLASSTVIDVFKEKVSLNKSRIISFFWAFILISIAIVFDETDEALVYIGIRIASLTYGGLLGIFLIHHINDKINSAQIIIGLVSSIITVGILLKLGVAWTLYILVSLTVFIITAQLAYYFNLTFNENHE